MNRGTCLKIVGNNEVEGLTFHKKYGCDACSALYPHRTSPRPPDHLHLMSVYSVDISEWFFAQ